MPFAPPITLHSRTIPVSVPVQYKKNVSAFRSHVDSSKREWRATRATRLNPTSRQSRAVLFDILARLCPDRADEALQLDPEAVPPAFEPRR